MSEKRASWLPSPVAWISATLLHVFWRFYAIAMAAVILRLIELAREWPRVAVLGGLAAWLGPIALVAFVHRAASAAVDGKRASALMSLWAGLYAWLVSWLATTVSMFAVLFVNPPRPEPDAWLSSLFALRGGAALFGLQTAVWLLVAVALYHVERLVKDRIAARAD